MAERLAGWLLLAIGCTLSLAALAVIMPFSWMVIVNNACGLSPIPDSPVFVYLARSASALYAVHGVFCLGLSLEVRRFRPLILLTAWLHGLFGLTILAIDLLNAMPWYWTLLEGPTILLGAATLRILCAYIPEE